MVKFVDRAFMTVTSTGTGAATLGAALDGYQTFADAGLSDGDSIHYTIEDDGDAWETGTGVLTGTSMSRTVRESSNGDALLNLSGNAKVFVTALGDDIGKVFVTPETLTHTGGTITMDLSGGGRRFFEFEADNYVQAATPEFISGGIAKSETGFGSVNVDLTGLVQDGDFVIAVAGARGSVSQGPYIAPQDWEVTGIVSQSSNRAVALYFTYWATGNETDITFDAENFAEGGVLGWAIFRGTDVGFDFSVQGQVSTTLFGLSYTADREFSRALAYLGINDNTAQSFGSPAAGWTEIAKDINVFSGDHGAVHLLYRDAGTGFGENVDGYIFSGHSPTSGWSTLGNYSLEIYSSPSGGVKNYTLDMTNIPAGDMTPVDLTLTVKEASGVWTFTDVDEWVNGAAPTAFSVGEQYLQFWVQSGRVIAEWLNRPIDIPEIPDAETVYVNSGVEGTLLLDPSLGTMYHLTLNTSIMTFTDGLEEGQSMTLMLLVTESSTVINWPTASWINQPSDLETGTSVFVVWKANNLLFITYSGSSG